MGKLVASAIRKLAPTLMVPQPLHCVFEQTFQFFRSAINGLFDRGRLIRDRDGFASFHACFDHATFVRAPAFLAVLIAEVDFDAGDMFRQVAERVFHNSFGLLVKFGAAFDIVVCVNLDLHKMLLLF